MEIKRHATERKRRVTERAGNAPVTGGLSSWQWKRDARRSERGDKTPVARVYLAIEREARPREDRVDNALVACGASNERRDARRSERAGKVPVAGVVSNGKRCATEQKRERAEHL